MVVGQPGKLVSVLRIVGSSPILVAKTREIIGSFLFYRAIGGCDMENSII